MNKMITIYKKKIITLNYMLYRRIFSNSLRVYKIMYLDDISKSKKKKQPVSRFNIDYINKFPLSFIFYIP